jgi:hypothetical protein
MAFAICLCQVCCGGQATVGQGGGSQNRPASNSELEQPAKAGYLEYLPGEEHWGKANRLRDGGKYEEAVKEYKQVSRAA